MGTTLALYGAYNLAGALLAHPDDTAAAFSEYQMRMRPSVDKAQKLMPGMLRILSPETAWGVWFIDTLIKILIWSRLGELLLRLKGADTEMETIHDYGI
jgi:2-polyprenyl-6-methoxyphenol hydroxylase-like FAD-dependent oxidoreductase